MALLAVEAKARTLARGGATDDAGAIATHATGGAASGGISTTTGGRGSGGSGGVSSGGGGPAPLFASLSDTITRDRLVYIVAFAALMERVRALDLATTSLSLSSMHPSSSIHPSSSKSTHPSSSVLGHDQGPDSTGTRASPDTTDRASRLRQTCMREVEHGLEVLLSTVTIATDEDNEQGFGKEGRRQSQHIILTHSFNTPINLSYQHPYQSILSTPPSTHPINTF